MKQVRIGHWAPYSFLTYIPLPTMAALQALEVAETELAGQRKQQEGLQKDVKRWEERKQKEDEVGLPLSALLRWQQQ